MSSNPLPERTVSQSRIFSGCVVASSVFLLANPTDAQEALQRSLAGEHAAEQVRQQLEDLPATIKCGDYKLQLQPSLGMTWSDNIRYSDMYKESDVILRPVLDMKSMYPISAYNALNFSVGVGYEAFLQHSDYNRLVVEPGSELAWNLFVRDFRFNIHERFSYEADPGRLSVLSDLPTFGGFYNNVGPSVLWDLKDVNLSLGYDFQRFLSSAGDYEYLDRFTHLVVGRVALKVHPSVNLGVETTVSDTTYDHPYLNDNTGLSGGVYARWQVTEQMTLRPRMGYAYYSFLSGPVYDQPSVDGYYWGLDFEHQVNQSFRYVLSGHRELLPGIYANILDFWQGRLQADWRVFRKVTLRGGFVYEVGKETAGFTGDDYDRFGFNCGISYGLTQRLSTSLGYNLYIKDSITPVRDYTQNRITLTLNYRL